MKWLRQPPMGNWALVIVKTDHTCVFSWDGVEGPDWPSYWKQPNDTSFKGVAHQVTKGSDLWNTETKAARPVTAGTARFWERVSRPRHRGGSPGGAGFTSELGRQDWETGRELDPWTATGERGAAQGEDSSNLKRVPPVHSGEQICAWVWGAIWGQERATWKDWRSWNPTFTQGSHQLNWKPWRFTGTGQSAQGS